MIREFNTTANVGKPQVVYRETISRESDAQGVFDKEVAGQQHYGAVSLHLRPLSRGSGNRFLSMISDESIPGAFIPAVEAGVMEAFSSGSMMGYPVVDVEVVLTGGSVKESLGSELAYRVSGSMACMDGLKRGEPYLLEPIMNVEVIAPEAFTGDVISDLNSRGGKIESIARKLSAQTIHATVPLSRMFGYSTSLRSSTQGRGTFTMQFSRFDRS
jgi:elongation factor G